MSQSSLFRYYVNCLVRKYNINSLLILKKYDRIAQKKTRRSIHKFNLLDKIESGAFENGNILSVSCYVNNNICEPLRIRAKYKFSH